MRPAMTTRDRDYAITPMMSDSFMIRSSSPSSLTSVPDHLPNSTLSPVFTSIGMSLPDFVAAAWSDGDHLTLHRLFLGGVGNDDAASGLLFSVETLDDDTVMQGAKFRLGHGDPHCRINARPWLKLEDI